MKIYNNKKLIEKYLKDTKYTYEDYQLILEHMEDEKSKNIFFNRIMSDCTSDPYYTLNMIKEMFKDISFSNMNQIIQKDFVDFLLKNNNYKKNIVVVGMKNEVMWVFSWLCGYTLLLPKVVGIYDYIDKEGEYSCRENVIFKYQNINSIPINKDYLYIIAKPELSFMKNYFLENNISSENIFAFDNSNFTHWFFMQYFGEKYIEPQGKEIFFDGGAYDLDTTLSFIDWSKHDYEKIYAAEPFTDAYENCLNIINADGLQNIEMLNVGLWSKKDKLKLMQNGTGGSSINESGNIEINVDSIDNILKGNKVTFIKLDIEGSEKEALIGAKKTIKKFKPRLAVSIYHKYLDSFDLALTLLELNENYKFGIRHYTLTSLETILYAY